MSPAIFTAFTEQEFKDLLKSTIREVLTESINEFRSAPPDTLTMQEAADFLKLKLTTMYEKTSRRQIPHSKKGNKLYFSRVELEEWIKKGKVKTSAEIESQATNYILNNKSKRH